MFLLGIFPCPKEGGRREGRDHFMHEHTNVVHKQVVAQPTQLTYIQPRDKFDIYIVMDKICHETGTSNKLYTLWRRFSCIFSTFIEKQCDGFCTKRNLSSFDQIRILLGVQQHSSLNNSCCNYYKMTLIYYLLNSDFSENMNTYVDKL